MKRGILSLISRWCLVWGIFVAALALSATTEAHEIRPAYLQIDQSGPSRYKVVWRTPILSGMRLPVALRFPASVRTLTDPAQRELPDSLVETRIIETDGESLAGKRVEFVGLQATITDVLVRVHLSDGTLSTTMVRPSHPWVEVASRPDRLDVATTFVYHGIEHILFGYDHLLFVLALVLIARSWGTLLLTVTAFTAAHSITLTLATLGFVHVPSPPVEAAIAFSILLLACEIIRFQRGGSSLTSERPWMVAFAFGLLHGLGFASALSDMALPSADIPLALFFFNVGVEIGQLMFIAAVIGIVLVLRPIRFNLPIGRHALLATACLIGTMASFWFIERVAAF